MATYSATTDSNIVVKYYTGATEINLGIEDYIEIRESVPHFEALKLMRKAHLLLLVKNYGNI